MQLIKLFVITMMVFMALDLIWLGFIAKNLYVSHYEPWLRLDENTLRPLWWAAGIVYFLFGIAIIAFVIPLAHHSLLWGLLYGALLGLVIYGVYDFTCLAVFKNMPVGMAFIDWLWGGVICSVTSMVAVFFSR